MRNVINNLLSIVSAKVILSVRRYKSWRAERLAFWDPETLRWHDEQWRKYEKRPRPGEGQ